MAGEPQTTRRPGRSCSSRCAPSPRKAAILTDFDGTLAPIVERRRGRGAAGRGARGAGAADRPLRAGRRDLRAARRRRARAGSALDGARLRGQPRAGADDAGRRASRGPIPRWTGARATRPSSSARSRRRGLDEAGLRLEDKGPIQALHWRGAADEAQAEAGAREIAVEAGRAGLEPHWGRKVLELRPVGGGGKDAAVASLLAGGRPRPRRLRGRRPHRRRRLPPARASCARRASWSPRSGSASSPPRGRRRSPRSPTSPSRARRAGSRSSPGWRS